MATSFRLLVDELTHGTIYPLRIDAWYDLPINVVNAMSLSSFTNLLKLKVKVKVKKSSF